MKRHEKVVQDELRTLLWFRRDFRLANNPALGFAQGRGGPITAIYIESDDLAREWAPGSASRWWCHHSLEVLAAQLAEQGIHLHFFKGDPARIIPALIKETGATAIAWNRLYEPGEIKLEDSVVKALEYVEVKRFDSHLLFTPGTILNQQDQAYKVFTPFWKNARSRLEVTGVSLVKSKKYQAAETEQPVFKSECKLTDLQLLDQHPWHEKLHHHWQPGEVAAHNQVKNFLKHTIDDYDQARDLPAIEGTSKMSPHLHFGEITPAQIVHQLLQKDLLYSGSASVERFLTELGWREFAHHVLWHFPKSTNQPMYKKFDRFWPKQANKKYLTAWQTGNTGIPLVDAGMRQLWESGWMHNRVRMIVGSFLTKNLGIHWLHGARWFWDTLVDADLANNSMGWQWVAGCGVDAAPYYRIFNPLTQQQRFDKDMAYVKQWVNEIEDDDYKPIIDLAKSRETALNRYNQIKGL